MSSFEMMSLMKFLLSGVTLLIVFGQINALNVSVYYESLSPESKQFITTQLFPVYYRNFRGEDVLDIQLVPFGIADAVKDDEGKWNFTCQHGEDECYGNKMQSCALFLLSTKARGIDFVNCVMASDDASDDVYLETCSKSTGSSWLSLQTCVETGFGDILLASNGRITDELDPPLSYVPTIIFDGKFDENLQDQAQIDFLQTICGLFQEKPSGCPQ